MGLCCWGIFGISTLGLEEKKKGLAFGDLARGGGGGSMAGTYKTVGTRCVVDVDPICAVVGVEVFAPVLVETTTATHDERTAGDRKRRERDVTCVCLRASNFGAQSQMLSTS